MKVARFGDKPVILDHIVSIEKGYFNQRDQYWYAVLLCVGNTRVETDISIDEAVAVIESADPTEANTPPPSEAMGAPRV